MKFKRNQRVLALLTSVLLFVSALAMPASAEGRFSDVSEGAWYYDAVNYVAEQGLFNGTGPDTFSPGNAMTRAMFVKVLSNKTENYKEDLWKGATRFVDVDASQWYSPAIQWASAAGIVKGVGKDRFSPEKSITREQMAVMLYQYAIATGNDTAVSGENVLADFPDAGSVSSWAKTAMEWAVSKKIINGADGYLLPRKTAKRCEVAKVFSSADSVLVKTTVETAPFDEKYANLEEYGKTEEGKANIQAVADAVNQNSEGANFSLILKGNSMIFEYDLLVAVDTDALVKAFDGAVIQLEGQCKELLAVLELAVEEPDPSIVFRLVDVDGKELYSREIKR